MVVPCAQLRVYVPAESLSDRERARWQGERLRPLALSEARSAEQQISRARLLTGRRALPESAVLVRHVDGEPFVCPLQFDLRSGAGLRRLRGELPARVVDSLVPDPTLRSRLEAAAVSGRAPTILDAAWSVPIPWFVLFDPAERRLRNHPEAAGARLLYLTTCAPAVTRLARAVDVVLATIEDADELVEEFAQLAAWLDSFDPRSLLELDYGGLARLLSVEQLEADTSVADIEDAIEALEAGDVLTAMVSYGTVRARWGPLRSRATAS